MEFLLSYFPLETTAHRDADLGPKQQVQWAAQWEKLELAERQMQNLKKECRTQTGSANCFYSCILASECLVQGSLFSRLLNCIPKSSDEPWEPATHTLGVKGRGAWSRLPAGPDHCGMLLSWAGRGMTSNCPCNANVITKACLAFFGTRKLAAQLLGRLRHLC